MNKTVHYQSKVLSLFFIIMISHSLHADDTKPASYFDAYNSPGLDQFENEYTDDTDFFDTEVPLPRSVSPVTIMQLLVGVNAPAILQIPLYKHTNVLNDRDLLDMPLFDPRGCLSCVQKQRRWDCFRNDLASTFDVSLFYNQTSRCYFTKESSNLNSYLALDEPSLLQLIENIFDNTQDFLQKEIDIRRLSAIFSQMTTQERRSGLMFEGQYEWPCGMMRLMIPLYWRERNFFIEDKLKEELEAIFGRGDPREEDQFQRKHFISDELGIGDTRLEGFYQFFNKPMLTVSIGGLLTLPTAATFVRGLRGRKTNFPKSSAEPAFSIEELFCLAFNGNFSQAVADISTFLLGALDRLAANLLDTHLGNNGHVGIGLAMLYTSPLSSWIDCWWTQRIFFRGRAYAEYLFPKTERRMFLNKIDYVGFSTRDFTSTDEAVAASNLLFLQNELINKLYLFGHSANIRPGLILRLTNKMCFEGDCWAGFLASDWWVQTKEHIRRVDASPETIMMLDLEKAKLSHAVQYKLLGGFDYTFHTPCCDVSLGLGADATIWSIGIGKDYTFQARCTVLF